MPDAPDRPDNIMMIGPTQAGKTTLLSVLRLASADQLNDASRVAITPINPEARQLFARARDIARTGNIVHAPNAGSNRYVFELTCDVERRVSEDRLPEWKKAVLDKGASAYPGPVI